ncbi:MAG: hypothetical protein OXH76_17375 [Boseongicola sp.]|nr:hypothetical protein [Boseongicola sp.]
MSIPDKMFERAERLALRGRRPRGEVCAAALDECIARHAPDEVADAMNRACGKVGEDEDAFLSAAGSRLLANVEW